MSMLHAERKQLEEPGFPGGVRGVRGGMTFNGLRFQECSVDEGIPRN
jgi:hypothetical protein